MEIDRARIAALLGDESKVDLFIGLFFEESAQQIQSLKNGVVMADVETVQRAAHSLKSHLNYVGLTALAKDAAWIEKHASPGIRHDDMMHRIDRLNDQLALLGNTNL